MTKEEATETMTESLTAALREAELFGWSMDMSDDSEGWPYAYIALMLRSGESLQFSAYWTDEGPAIEDEDGKEYFTDLGQLSLYLDTVRNEDTK